MFRIACILLALSLSGCAALKHPGLAYAHWKQDLRNDRNQRFYRKAVAQQAKAEQLTGTWTRTEVALLGKKLGNQQVTRHTLTLFQDQRYLYRTDTTGPWLSPRRIDVTNGSWAKLETGMIQLTRAKSSADEKPTTLSLDTWTNPFVENDRQVRESAESRYASSIVVGSDNLPIIVLHHCDQDDIGDVIFGTEFHEPRFLGSFVPDAGLIHRADKALLERLRQEKPGKAYLRQYAGYRTRSHWQPMQRYLRIHLTATKTSETKPALDGLVWPKLLSDVHRANDGGDDHAQAVYDVERGVILSLHFNGDV